jgi:hypothetical protein
MRIGLGALAGIGLATAATLAVARLAFDRRIAGEVAEISAPSADAKPAITTESDLVVLPEPVQRWLRYSQVVGKERPVTVRLKQEGQFRLSPEQGWMPFTADQYFTTDPPALLWKATFRMAPLLTITGRDRYKEGEGSIDMRILSLIPVARKEGGDLNQGALLRYLGEIIWFPAAAISPHITWEGIDANSARATMSYGGITAPATFHFDDEGRFTGLTALRNNDATGKPERWSIPVSGYGEFQGVRIPTEGDGVWQYETGDFPYIHWRITDIQYSPPDPR